MSNKRHLVFKSRENGDVYMVDKDYFGHEEIMTITNMSIEEIEQLISSLEEVIEEKSRQDPKQMKFPY